MSSSIMEDGEEIAWVNIAILVRCEVEAVPAGVLSINPLLVSKLFVLDVDAEVLLELSLQTLEHGSVDGAVVSPLIAVPQGHRQEAIATVVEGLETKDATLNAASYALAKFTCLIETEWE